MTKRQASDKAHQLADSEQRTFVVLTSVGRKATILPLADLDFTFVASQNALVVPPTGQYNGYSAAQIIAAEMAR